MMQVRRVRCKLQVVARRERKKKKKKPGKRKVMAIASPSPIQGKRNDRPRQVWKSLLVLLWDCRIVDASLSSSKQCERALQSVSDCQWDGDGDAEGQRVNE